MKNFNFSDSLREKVELSLINRIVDAIRNDHDTAHDMVQYGMPGVSEMSAQELMDEYCNWHGLYDIHEDINDIEDNLLRRMLKEITDNNFESEMLDENNYDDDSTN